MQYKTTTLALLQEQPELYEQLRSSKRLLTAMDAYATQLKSSHEMWKERLGQSMPHSDPRQIANEAMELAVQALRDRLHSASPATGADPLSLDAAMHFLRASRPA